MKTADVIVLGTGAMGSSACFRLARAGVSVLGIDRFSPPHSLGSSHGETRLTRLAYFEDPAYVPLLKKSHSLVRELEQESQRRLYFQSGLYYFGFEDSEVLSGVKRSASLHRLSIDSPEAKEVSARFPVFKNLEKFKILFEWDAGLLFIEKIIEEYLRGARAAGADLHTNETVLDWSSNTQGVHVKTDKGSYSARKLVICAGAWNPALFQLPIPLGVHRQTLFWFPHSPIPDDLPCFSFDMGDTFFYGFPPVGNGIKLAEHLPGRVVLNPLEVDRVVTADEHLRLTDLVETYFNGVEGTPIQSSVCLYTMTPDRHFVIDRHPQFENVLLAGGFSGHGFKFAPVVGEILTDLALNGKTDHPIALFSATRGALSPLPRDRST